MTGQNENTDYSNGKIYVIISPNHDLFYYGSTVLTIEQRFNIHKAKSSRCTSRKIIDAGNAEIFEIESYPCSCLEELEDREAFYIVNDWEGSVNDRVPGAMRRAGGKKAYAATPKVKAKQKEYKNEKIPCNICGCMTMRKNKLRHQRSKTCPSFLSNELNANPEYKEYQKEKIPCNICGCMTMRKHKARHQRSKTCQKYLNDELGNLMNDIITQIEQQ